MLGAAALMLHGIQVSRLFGLLLGCISVVGNGAYPTVMPSSLLVVFMWALLVIGCIAYWAALPNGGLHGLLAGFTVYRQVA